MAQAAGVEEIPNTTLADVKIARATRLALFVAPVGTDMPTDLKPFRIDNPSGWGKWKWLGDHSNEGRFEPSIEGGEVEYIPTADRQSVMSTRSDTTATATFSSVNLNKSSIENAFGKSAVKEEAGGFVVSADTVATSRALLAVATDDTQISGIGFYNTTIAGTFPLFPADDLINIPMNVSILADSQNRRLKVFPPVARA